MYVPPRQENNNSAIRIRANIFANYHLDAVQMKKVGEISPATPGPLEKRIELDNANAKIAGIHQRITGDPIENKHPSGTT